MSTAQPVHHIVAEQGAAELLNVLTMSSEAAFDRIELEDLMLEQGIANPSEMLDRLRAANMLQLFGSRFGISVFGRRTSLLIEAINGGDIHDLYQQLRHLDGVGDMYAVVQTGMTKRFLESLSKRPGIGRLFICSPWINPSDREAAYLKYAVYEAEKRTGDRPEVYVICRDPKKMREGYEKGLEAFIDVGASIYFNERIHSKLYIREPGSGGGYLMAIVGSQNLTRSNYVELGIQITNDNQIINQLVGYFFTILSRCAEREGA